MVALALVAFLLFILALGVGLLCLLSLDTNKPDTHISIAIAMATYDAGELGKGFAALIPAARQANEAFARFNRAWMRSEL